MNGIRERVARTLRRETGSSDPILVLGVIATGLVLISLTFGIVKELVQFTANYTATQQASTTFAQAQRAFADEMAGSTSVTVADGKNGAGQAVTIFTPMPANAAGDVCQVSTWQATSEDAGEQAGLGQDKNLGKQIVLEETVRLSKSSACNAIPSGSGTSVLRIPGWTAFPTWTFKNPVGSTVTWKAGAVSKVTADAATKKQGYATAAEMADKQLATVTMSGTLDLPIGKKTTEQLSGHGARKPVVSSSPSAPETLPGRLLFAPQGTPTAKAATSGFAKVAGEVQGINVAATRGAPSECGALPYYSVKLTVTPVTPSGTATSFTASDAFDATKTKGSVGLGAGGRVKVAETLTCPPVSDGGNQSGTPKAVTVTYTQPLPAPTVTITEISPSKWKASWDKVSSLTTTFTITEKEAGSAFATATTSATSVTFTTPAPAYGTTVSVTVKAAAGVLTSSGSAKSGVVSWPAATWSPTLHDTGVTGEQPQNHSPYVTGSGCPSGTGTQVEAFDSGIGAYSGWVSGTSAGYSMSEAYSTSYLAVGEVRCATPYSISGETTTSVAWTTHAPPPPPPVAHYGVGGDVCAPPNYIPPSDTRERLNEVNHECYVQTAKQTYDQFGNPLGWSDWEPSDPGTPVGPWLCSGDDLTAGGYCKND
ncbi:hypothetical protein GCM10022286_00700 [Gryllotalpicola daejeonensis]|uniref:Uncharacterized protein n=1 Tax=Gryllotalpicola daejeonensis TaxID=993087 RepID=A0ABP7ZCT0_9MICO